MMKTLTLLQQRARLLREKREAEEENKKEQAVKDTAEMQVYLIEKFREDFPDLYQLLVESAFHLSSAYADKEGRRKYYLVLAHGERRTMISYEEDNYLDTNWIYNLKSYPATQKAEDALTVALDDFFFT